MQIAFDLQHETPIGWCGSRRLSLLGQEERPVRSGARVASVPSIAAIATVSATASTAAAEGVGASPEGIASALATSEVLSTATHTWETTAAHAWESASTATHAWKSTAALSLTATTEGSWIEAAKALEGVGLGLTAGCGWRGWSARCAGRRGSGLCAKDGG